MLRPMKRRTQLSWSSGKDSAWTLYTLQQDPNVALASLLTTVNVTHGRVAMHAVREELLRAQAQAAGLPLRTVPIPSPCSNAEYEAAMETAMQEAQADGVQDVAFGDLFLQDIRDYREAKLRKTGLRPVFPLWQKPTQELAREMLAGGLQAVLTCVDPRQCPPEFAGRAYDEALLAALPPEVDPCGENGEFHTLVHAGPMFQQAIPIEVGEVIERDGFVFADVMLRS